MKTNYLIYAIVFALLGCSDTKEAPNDLNKQSKIKNMILVDNNNVIDNQQEGPKSRPTQGKLCLEGCRGLPCDEKVRCVMRNCPNIKVECEENGHEQFDLNELGIPAFLSAEKEFSAKWNYAGSKKVLKRIIDKICRTERRCAPRIDSSAYRKNVFFILDSLAQNKQLDSLIADIEQRDYEFSSPEQHEKRVKKILDSLLKKNPAHHE